MDTELKQEIRAFDVRELRADDDANSISGYASVFNQPIEMIRFQEVVRPGAFARTIQEDTVFAAWNHNLDTVFASNKAGTIVLREDPVGLHFEIKPPAAELTSLRARYDEMRDMVRGGLIDKMSFGFNVTRQTWSEIDAKTDLREINEVKLWEISLVPFPAYEGTSVSARSVEAVADERRAMKEQEAQAAQSALDEQKKFDESNAEARAIRSKSLRLKLKLAAR
jgi:uncharacterized protein